jgi:pimeloyl-ACP methyl ester carboxylesterase
MKAPITCPVLHVQGAADPTVLPSSARGSGQFVSGRYEYAEMDSVGHFPHEERPEAFTDLLLDWLATV